MNIKTLGKLGTSRRGIASFLALGTLALMAVPAGAQVIMRTIRLVSSTVSSVTTSSAAWVPIPLATTTVTIPAGQTDRILARFAGESACWGASGYCQLRILANGVEMNAAGGTNFAFDSSDSNTETAASWESHAIERYRQIANTTNVPLNVIVQVEYRVSVANLNFWIDDWNLTVQQHNP